MRNTHSCLDHLVQTRPRCLQDRFRVLAHLMRLLGHGAFDQLALVVPWDLTREPDKALGFDGMRLQGCEHCTLFGDSREPYIRSDCCERVQLLVHRSHE
jgi:hypothetical protein